MTYSFIIPTYNSGKHILACLSSCIAALINEEYEIIVIDDCSSDDTCELIQRFVLDQACNVQLLRNSQNKGPAHSRNRGIREAKGDFIVFLDSDDLMLPNRLIDQRAQIKESASGMCFGGLEEVSEGGQLIRTVIRPFPRDIQEIKVALVLDELHALTSTVMLKKEVVKEVGEFDENLMHFEDYHFFLRCMSSTKPVYLEKPVIRKRVHGASMSYTVSIDEFIESRSYFIREAMEIDSRFESLYTRFWAKQYFGLGRLCQIKGKWKEAFKYYFKSLKHGNISASFGIILLFFPAGLQKKLAQRRWRR